MQRKPPSAATRHKPRAPRRATIPEVPTVLPNPKTSDLPRSATTELDDQAHEAIRRMIEAAYT